MKRMSSDTFIASFATLPADPHAAPVVVTRDGRDTFVVLSVEAYARLKEGAPDGGATEAIPDIDLDAVEWNR